jgi:hypothetical protein
MRFFIAAALLILLIAGCARTRPVPVLDTSLPAGFPNHRVEQIQQNILFATDTLVSYRAKASFSVTSPERSGRFSADLRNRRGDSLYISISPGLGIEAVRVLVTPDSVYYYDRIKSELMVGALSRVGDLLAIPVSSEDLFRNLLGIVAPETEEVWNVEADSAYYYLRNNTNTRVYVIDPSLWRVVRYTERAPNGEILEERIFSEYDVFNGVYIPRRIVFRRPQENSVASIFYRDLDLNPEELSFELRVRESARRTKLE